MTNSYTCPQDGCDFGESEEKSLAAVRGHISAASSHEWDELKGDLYAQAEDAETENDGVGEGEGDDGDDQTDDNDDEMATQEEYERQYEGDEPSKNQQDDDGADGDPDGSDDSPGFHIPAVGGTTLLAVAGVLLVAFIAWKVLGDSGVDHEPAEEQADTDDSDAGMVDVEAGTGGVSV